MTAYILPFEKVGRHDVDTVGGNQVLDGSSGNDTILGFGSLIGGAGDDSLRVGGTPPGPSTLIGGAGTDTCTPFS